MGATLPGSGMRRPHQVRPQQQGLQTSPPPHAQRLARQHAETQWTLLNDPAFVECAEAFARSVDAEGSDGFVGEVFLRCLGREPDAEERTLLTEYAAGEPPARARIAVCSVVLNLDEAVTR